MDRGIGQNVKMKIMNSALMRESETVDYRELSSRGRRSTVSAPDSHAPPFLKHSFVVLVGVVIRTDDHSVGEFPSGEHLLSFGAFGR